MLCRRCAAIVPTLPEQHTDIVTHVTAMLLFFIGCWPFCFVPYCSSRCKSAHHYCRYCRTYLGTYRPW
ncbi:unnamed protein product [Trichogramma brassicae]|uniref:LITAF domain-containing protein n=1 Tax=Trichogramma brassicae TaxID=86971 RepID=A0A6H5IY58_9HYME|nr:unnamed protein product [Trichogramma brassicae]